MNCDFEEAIRLQSFTPCLNYFKKSTVLLARNGFKAILNSTDQTICVFCRLFKEGWMEDDDIEEIHKNLSPFCSLFKGSSGNIPFISDGTRFDILYHRLADVNVNSDNNNVLVANVVRDRAIEDIDHENCTTLRSGDLAEVRDRNSEHFNEADAVADKPSAAFNGHFSITKLGSITSSKTSSLYKAKYFKTVENLKHWNPTSTALTAREDNLTKEMLGIIYPEIRFPNYTKKENRQKSFPENLNHPKACKFSEAGFFYLGIGDEVQSFCCGIKLKNFCEKTNIWRVHAMRNLRCKYVYLMKGSKFINSVSEMMTTENTTLSQRLAEEIDLQTEDTGHAHLVCKSCRLNKAQVVPECGHNIICVECSLEYRCKMCKDVSWGLIRVTLPQ